MAVNVASVTAAGIHRVDYGVVGSDGFLLGSTATAPAAGVAAGSAMARLRRAQNFPYRPAATQRNTVTGDNEPASQFLFVPTELPSGTLVFGASDMNFEALVTSMKKRDVGDISLIGIQQDGIVYRDMVMLVQSNAKVETDDASAGSSHWEGLVILKCNVQPMDRDPWQERTNATYLYDIVSNKASVHPWGEAMSVLNDGTLKMPAFRFTSPYRTRFQRWTGNGVLTTFTLAEEPVPNATMEFNLWVGGVAQVYTTDFTISGTDLIFEAGAIPAASDEVVGWFGCLNN